jgi:uncharacterized protein
MKKLHRLPAGGRPISLDRNKQRQNRLILFFGCTFLLSWIIWFPGLLHARGVIELERAGQTLVQIGAYAPTVAALLLVRIIAGRKRTGAVKDLLRRAVEMNFSWKWYLFAVLLAPVLMGTAYICTRVATGFTPGLEIFRKPYLVFIFLPYILFLGGPLGEELGWRGYALPRLLRRFRPISASLILGGIWAVWHLPQFFMEGTVQSLIPFYGYAIVTVFNSIFITVLFLQTGGSVFAAILYHLFSNFSYSLFPVFQTQSGQIWILIVFTAAAAGIITGFRNLLFSKNRRDTIAYFTELR